MICIMMTSHDTTWDCRLLLRTYIHIQKYTEYNNTDSSRSHHRMIYASSRDRQPLQFRTSDVLARAYGTVRYLLSPDTLVRPAGLRTR